MARPPRLLAGGEPPDSESPATLSASASCMRQKSRQRFTTEARRRGGAEARRHGAEQLWDDWHHLAKGRGSIDRINRINRIPICCISDGDYPVDPVHPVQSSDQHRSRAFSHMWSSPCLRVSVVNFRTLPTFVMHTPLPRSAFVRAGSESPTFWRTWLREPPRIPFVPPLPIP